MPELWTPRMWLLPVRGANLPILMFDPSTSTNPRTDHGTGTGALPRGPYSVASESKVADKILNGSWFIHPWELTPGENEHRAFVDRIGRECRNRSIQLRPSPQSSEHLTVVFGLVFGLDRVTVPTPDHLGASVELLKRYRRTQQSIPADTELST